MSTALRTYFRGRNLVSMRDQVAGQSAYYHFDHQGTTQCLTDSTGAVTDRFASDAWGVQVKHTGSSINRSWYIGNSGYLRQVDQSLDYVRNRYYARLASRWLSQDPIGPSGGANLFVYVSNRPVVSSDASGLIGNCIGSTPTVTLVNQHADGPYKTSGVDPSGNLATYCALTAAVAVQVKAQVSCSVPANSQIKPESACLFQWRMVTVMDLDNPNNSTWLGYTSSGSFAFDNSLPSANGYNSPQTCITNTSNPPYGQAGTYTFSMVGCDTPGVWKGAAPGDTQKLYPSCNQNLTTPPGNNPTPDYLFIAPYADCRKSDGTLRNAKVILDFATGAGDSANVAFQHLALWRVEIGLGPKASGSLGATKPYVLFNNTTAPNRPSSGSFSNIGCTKFIGPTNAPGVCK